MTAHFIEAPPSPRLTRSIVRMNADQYHQMLEKGIIPEDASTELLDGIIVSKDRSELGEEGMGHSPLHVLAVSLLGALSVRVNGPEQHLNIQLPISLDGRNEPEPDASIIRGQPRDYAGRLPGASDTCCVIEVAHSSLERDAEVKYASYAAAGIWQYVIVNLRESVLEIHTAPERALGRYAAVRRVGKGESFQLHLGGGRVLEVLADDLLP